jgi:hypothetical protein
MTTTLEHILTTRHKAEIIGYLNAHPDEFREAVQLALDDKQPYSWRAAWLLWSCMERDDKRIKKHLNKIITILPFRNESQQRDLMMILLRMQLNDEQQSRLFDVCSEIWFDIKKKPSVRINAFKIILAIGKKHPELFPEIRLMIESHYTETLSPGVKHSLSKMMAGMK